MPTSSLLKSYLHNSIAEGLYNEIQNLSARYYYFLGKTIAWDNESNPPYPIDSFAYELDTRKEIITMKQIKSTDVAFVIPRVNWTSGTIYDMYDDQYSDEVQGINLTSGGSNYSSSPTVTISGGGGTGATATALIDPVNNVVVGITLTSRGRNYTSVPTVTISGGGGNGATATADVTIGYSGATKLEDTNCYVLTNEYYVYKCLDNNNNATSTYKPVGTVVDPVIMPDGYMWKYLYSIPVALRNKFLTDAYMPVVNSLSLGNIDTLQANIELLTPNGSIMAYSIISGGYGYATAPTITIDGDGTGAVATAVVQNGTVTKINVSNYGLGYTWAIVTISGGSGNGAAARAVISPYGGHGKDPINDLFSRTLMFYTNISNEDNQGFNVNNDFRQLGIIKNPRQFDNIELLKTSLSSACYVVAGNISTSNFTPDMNLFLGNLQGRKFRIVAVTSTAALVQSLDNAIPVDGSVFFNSSSQTFTVTGVTPPAADKYSGDLLFIDNKQAFTPTANQTVTLRTIIKF